LNPALAWVERRLCFERELACDERVLRARGRGAAKAYAACLAGLAEHRLGRAGLALALGALGRESELGRRVREILGGAERMRPAQARLVLGGAVLGLVAAAAGLSRCPQVVGFSQGAAVASAPKVDLADRAQFQTVGFRGTEIHLYNNGLQQRSNVPHETLLEALTPSLNGGYGDDTISRGLKPEVIRGSMSGLKPGPISGTRAAVDFSGTRAAVDVSGTRAAVDVSGARSSPFDKLRAGSGAPGTVAVQRQPTLRDEAAKDGPPSEVAVEAPIRREGPTGEGAVGWVVVTTWEGADGSRLVLTTFDTAEPARSAPPPAILDDQVHPYAAVPLRDGWLVIQL